MDCSDFTDIPCPWMLGRGQNLGHRDFCHILTLLMPGASVFLKHMSSSILTYCKGVLANRLVMSVHLFHICSPVTIWSCSVSTIMVKDRDVKIVIYNCF